MKWFIFLKNLKTTVKELNSNVNNVANTEKAKQLKDKLLKYGIPLSIVGGVGVLIAIILGVGAFSALMESKKVLPVAIILPIVFFVIFSALLSIGITFLIFGLKIMVVEYTSDIIEESFGCNCPKCGARINDQTVYCPTCGVLLKKECSNCKHINNPRATFCEKCGKKLN